MKYTTEEFDNKLNEALKESKSKPEGKKTGRGGRRGRSYKEDTGVWLLFDNHVLFRK